MDRCWARSLGDCSDRLSGEHYITAGLFGEKKLSVQGLAWCKTEIKEVGKKSLVKNVLCTNHNSRLSLLDEEAIRAFDVFRECVRLTDVRQTMKARHWNVQHWNIDGTLLERWFLKTLINFASEGNEKIGPASEENGRPSPDLVKIAYGLDKFQGKAGLYTLAAPGLKLNSEDRVEYMPIGNPNYLAGGLFLFRGYFFVLYLDTGGLDPNADMRLPGPLPFGAMATGGMNVRPTFHLKAMKFAIQARTSHVINLKW